MTALADAVAFFVAGVLCGWFLTKIGAVLYGFVRFFATCFLQWRERRRVERALRRRVHEHIQHRVNHPLRVVRK